MDDFKKHGGFGGGDRGGSRGGFGGGGFGGGNRSRFNRPGNREFRQTQMFSATCAECGKACEVPFRPNGEKPVYCSYCFNKNKGGGAGEYPRKDSSSFDSRPSSQGQNGGDLKKQLDLVIAKLDKLMDLISKGSSVMEKPIVKEAPAKKAEVKAEAKAEVKEAKVEKVAKKKAVSKKK